MAYNNENGKRVYLDLMERVKILSAQNVSEGINQVEEIILQEKAIHYSHYNSALDAELSSCTSKAIVTLTSNVTNEVNFYDKDALSRHVKMNPIFWHFSFPREVPVVSYLYGTFEPITREKKKRAPRRIRVEKQAGPARKPAKLASTLNKSKEDSMAAAKIYQFLRSIEGGCCSYYHLVLDPNCFSKTIENIYNIALLIKEGLVEIFINKQSGLPHIKYLEPNKEDVENRDRKYFIETIDRRLWKEMIQALHIKTPLLGTNDITDNVNEDEEMSSRDAKSSDEEMSS